MADRDELKACPFCKSPATRRKKGGFLRRMFWYPGMSKVSCSNDGCGAFFSYWSADEWNARAPIQPVATQEDAGKVQAGGEFKAPKWYTRDEIVSILRSMNYSDYIAEELADWMVRHLQFAFNKGFQVRGYDEFLTKKAVGFVTVGSGDHGPYTFEPTAYGADKLADGRHEVYSDPIPTASHPSNAVQDAPQAGFDYRAEIARLVSVNDELRANERRLIDELQAATVPPVVQAPSDEQIASLNAEIKRLHVKLAGETLRADQGWERYEAANKSHMACVNERAALLTTASNAGEAAQGEES